MSSCLKKQATTYMKIWLLRSRPIKVDLANGPDPSFSHCVSCVCKPKKIQDRYNTLHVCMYNFQV
jgi:hypothetical protein